MIEWLIKSKPLGKSRCFSFINKVRRTQINMASQDKIKTHQKDDGLLGVASRTNIKTGDVFSDVSSLIEKARHAAYKSVNVLLIQRNWLIGKRIHEEELKDTRKENYGLEIIKSLSKRLTEKYGKGFGRMSLYNFFTFYKEYPNIFQTPFGQSFLSWSHYLILLQVDDKKAREWYEKEASSESWSVRTLQRNVSTQYYYRILKSQKKELVAKRMLKKADDTPEYNQLEFIKNPTILEFLNLPENNEYIEKDLEECLIQNIKKFLMELGKGYAFVTSQKRIHTREKRLLHRPCFL